MQTRILQFVLLSKASFSYNRTLLNLYWLSDGGGGEIGGWVLLRFIKSFMRISWISLKNWHYRKKCTVVSASMPQEHNWFKVSSKLGLDVNKTIWINPIYHKLYYKITSIKNVLKILTILCLEIPFSKNSCNQSIDFKSINWFLYETSFYWKVTPNRF